MLRELLARDVRIEVTSTQTMLGAIAVSGTAGSSIEDVAPEDVDRVVGDVAQ